jgi:hypothetical protein
MARRFCLLGCTDADLGRSFGVDELTIQRWMDDYPSFRVAVKAGREDADARMAESLWHRGIGYSHKAEKITVLRVPVVTTDEDGNAVRTEDIKEFRSVYTENYPPDTASAIFWLKNRRRDLWRDAPQVVVNNTNNQLTVTGDPVAVSQNYRKIMDIDG